MLLRYPERLYHTRYLVQHAPGLLDSKLVRSLARLPRSLPLPLPPLRSTSCNLALHSSRSQIITIIGFVYGDPNRLIYPRDHEVRRGEGEGDWWRVIVTDCTASIRHRLPRGAPPLPSLPPPFLCYQTDRFFLCTPISPPPHPTPSLPLPPRHLQNNFCGAPCAKDSTCSYAPAGSPSAATSCGCVSGTATEKTFVYYPKLSEDLLTHAALVAQVHLAAGRRRGGWGGGTGRPFAIYWG